MKTTQELIVVEVSLAASAEQIWAALTEPSKMVQWFFEEIETFVPEVGAESSFIVSNEGRDFDHRWSVKEVHAPTKIRYGWRYEGYSGDSEVTFEVSETTDGSKLRLTHEVLEDFPDGVPEFTREACHGGWRYFLEERLPRLFTP